MKILSVELENVFCYYGTQSIDLSPEPGKPVVVVHGENGYGKTRLFLAISWCLFSVRRRRKLDPISVFNWDALEEGRSRCSVKLVIEVDGGKLTVCRWYERLPGTDPPKFSAEFSCVSDRNETVVEEDFDSLLARVFPYDVSTLFLFDGEELDSYEALVEEDDSKALSDQLKEKLEMVLGVPVLQAARDAAAAARDKMREIYTSTLAQEGVEAATRKDFSEVEEKIGEFQRRQQALELEKVKVQDDLGKIQRELLGLEAAQSLVRKKLEHQEKLLTLDLRLADAYHRRSMASTPLYLEILRPRLQETLSQFRREDSEGRKGPNQAIKISGQIELINELISDGRCLCSTALDPAHRTFVQSRRTALEAAIPKSMPAAGQTIPWGWVAQQIEDVIAPDYWSEYQSTEAETSKLLVEKMDLQGKIQIIDGLLRESTQGQIRSLSDGQSELSKSLAQIEAGISELDGLLVQAQSRFKGLEAQVLKGRLTSDALRAEKKRLDVAIEAADTLEAAIEELRQLKRQEVEKAASKAFLALTTNPYFHSLRIQKNYGLILQTAAGRDIPARSAGEGQIVALSLLSGLNQCTSVHAPIIMDTPFGRLDPAHRANVLRHLSGMGEQVVLLATSAEMSDKEMAAIRSIVARERNLERFGLGRSRFAAV